MIDCMDEPGNYQEGWQMRATDEGMLVIPRSIGESITIGDDVVVTVYDLRDGKVRIGVSAPTDVSIHRTEVYEARKRAGA
jgi:carbon storage regulator